MSMDHGTGPHPKDPADVGLPGRVFLYTLDQISFLLEMPIRDLAQRYIYYEDRSLGARPKDRFKAVNIAPDDQRPEWRVSEQELIRWMKYKQIRYYQRGLAK